MNRKQTIIFFEECIQFFEKIQNFTYKHKTGLLPVSKSIRGFFDESPIDFVLQKQLGGGEYSPFVKYFDYEYARFYQIVKHYRLMTKNVYNNAARSQITRYDTAPIEYIFEEEFFEDMVNLFRLALRRTIKYRKINRRLTNRRNDYIQLFKETTKNYEFPEPKKYVKKKERAVEKDRKEFSRLILPAYLKEEYEQANSQ